MNATYTTLKKGNLELRVCQHLFDRLEEKFNLKGKLHDSFSRSKEVTQQNSARFGKTIANRAYSKIKYGTSQKLFVNTYFDQVYIVDVATKVLVTTYRLSTAKPWYEV